jgi:hypothetical protein
MRNQWHNFIFYRVFIILMIIIKVREVLLKLFLLFVWVLSFMHFIICLALFYFQYFLRNLQICNEINHL